MRADPGPDTVRGAGDREEKVDGSQRSHRGHPLCMCVLHRAIPSLHEPPGGCWESHDRVKITPQKPKFLSLEDTYISNFLWYPLFWVHIPHAYWVRTWSPTAWGWSQFCCLPSRPCANNLISLLAHLGSEVSSSSVPTIWVANKYRT